MSGKPLTVDEVGRLYEEARYAIWDEVHSGGGKIEYEQFEIMKYLGKTLNGFKFRRVGN